MIIRAALLVICAAGGAGCFTSNVVVTVRPDGSGVVEQTATIRPAAMLEFDKLASPDLAANRQNPQDVARQFQKEFEKVSQGTIFGGNLRLRSTRPINTADATGWALTYDVDDVTGMRLQLLPQMPGLHGQGFYGVATKDRSASTTLTTTLEPLNETLQRLTVQFPRFAMDPSAEPPANWASGSPQEMAEFRKLLRGSRITIAVETTAPIVRTNSPYRDQNRVTLLDIDVEQALFSKQISMLASTPATFDELLLALADLPGVTLAHDREITIDFENPSTRISTRSNQPATAPSPDSEIFLASLFVRDGKVAVGAPVNITKSPGYDNQPSFTPDGNRILFASVRGRVAPSRDGAAAAGSRPPATDIYRYDIATRVISRITNTPEGEFSPAVMPDGKNISVVRVEPDGTQRLWRIADNDSAKNDSVILRDIKPVGYYTWIDDHRVALFVLGERGQPSTLQVAEAQTGTAQGVATDIGRSIQRMPSGDVSFIARRADGSAPSIHRLFKTPDQSTFRAEPLCTVPPGVTEPYVVWLPDGSALLAVKATLFRWRRGETSWTPVSNLAAFGLRDVTRLAISPAGDRLAIVASAK